VKETPKGCREKNGENNYAASEESGLDFVAFWTLSAILWSITKIYAHAKGKKNVCT